MKKSLRRPLVAGNWKMNNTRPETAELIKNIIDTKQEAHCDIVICVPYTDLDTAITSAKGTDIRIGAQNCHWKTNGAYTGEISADMLYEVGVEYVIVGHSERRLYFGETDKTVNARAKAAIEADLTAIICVGEQLEQRENGVTEEVVSMQVKAALKGITAEQMGQVVIAYEPIWAIGTGKTATPEQADEVCCYIRWVIEELFDNTVASATQILYGGSMNGTNAKELLSMEDIDGGLIGGASLKAEEFYKIIAATLGSSER
ncbi:MAG: triose-phosphate isomerase [Oscillospiraceae bacterium]